MKKIFSLILAGAAVILISVCAFAAENIDKFFVLKAGDGVAAYEAAAFASENGFDGILVDCRNGYSEGYIDSLLSSTDGIRLFALCRSDSSAALFAKDFEYILIPAPEATEENLSALGEKAGLFLPFGSEDATKSAFELYSSGCFRVMFAENLCSSYSETGYEN